MRSFLALLTLGICLAACATVKPGQTSGSEIKILSRVDWEANPPVAEMKAHTVSRITIHHTATLQNPRRGLADKMLALQRFSQNPGTLGNGKTKPAWPDVPYHFYIDCHGEVAEGRDAGFVGDTNTAYDPAGHLLVVLEGNFEEEQPGERQLVALEQIINVMKRRHHIAPENIGSHKEFAETLCPGKNLQTLMTEIRRRSAKK